MIYFCYRMIKERWNRYDFYDCERNSRDRTGGGTFWGPFLRTPSAAQLRLMEFQPLHSVAKSFVMLIARWQKITSKESHKSNKKAGTICPAFFLFVFHEAHECCRLIIVIIFYALIQSLYGNKFISVK